MVVVDGDRGGKLASGYPYPSEPRRRRGSPPAPRDRLASRRGGFALDGWAARVRAGPIGTDARVDGQTADGATLAGGPALLKCGHLRRDGSRRYRFVCGSAPRGEIVGAGRYPLRSRPRRKAGVGGVSARDRRGQLYAARTRSLRTV